MAQNGDPRTAKLVKHVTIVGKGRGALKRFPPGEVWGVNTRDPAAAVGTRWFQIHPASVLTEREALWLRYCPFTIYVIKRGMKMSRHATPYPLKDVPRGPFASSFDYMMALAIHEEFSAITLTGVDLQVGTLRERLCEHVSLAYWIGAALGNGIDVRMVGCHAFDFPWRYGFDYWRERRWGQQQARAALAETHMDDGQAKPGRRKGVVDSGKLR